MENYTFYPGQKVACVKRGGSWKNSRESDLVGPQYDDVLLITATRIDAFGDFGLAFSEWPGRWFSAKCFRPLDTLTEQIERIEKEGAPLELATA